ncbi:MAG: GIY-YIG nuclease family protein [Anaerolineales bacterium]|jgi:putative endonuclease|nr:GIY-YIG nuclease family protein [Anaerolineales bacterium]
MTNWKHTVLYTDVTNNLARRVEQHRSKQGSTFTSRYNVTKLVLVEVVDQIHDAIAREKQIKAGSRQDKIDLIAEQNPDWKDLYDEFFAA